MEIESVVIFSFFQIWIRTVLLVRKFLGKRTNHAVHEDREVGEKEKIIIIYLPSIRCLPDYDLYVISVF